VPKIRKCRALHPLPNTSSWHTWRTDLPFHAIDSPKVILSVCFADVVPCIRTFWKIPLIFKCHQVVFSALLGWLFLVIRVRAAFIVGTGHHLHACRLGVSPTVVCIGVKSVPQQTASLCPVHTANIVIKFLFSSIVNCVYLVWVN